MMIINSYAYATGGGGGPEDVTPDALDPGYTTYNEYSFFENHDNKYFRIQGIDSSITLRAEISDINGSFYYKKSATVPTADLTASPFSFEIWKDGETITVSNNEYVTFGAYYGNFGLNVFSVQILNESDSDTLLTTVTCQVDIS